MRHRIMRDGDVSTAWTLGDPDRTGVAFRYITEAYADEPLFCVRGRDRLAVPAATFYLGLVTAIREEAIGPVSDAVRADIAAIQGWQAAHPDLLKYPDR